MPASVLTRVRASLGAEAVPTKNSFPRWTFAYLTGALVVAFAFGVLPRGEHRHSTQVTALPPKQSMDTVRTASNVAKRKAVTSGQTIHSRLQKRASPFAYDRVEVLVSPDEEEFLKQFYANRRKRIPDVRTVVAEERELTPKRLEIDQIEVTKLKIEGITELSRLSR
jgi:hypothetical protein